MLFDPNNPIIKFCAQGMSLEGEGKPAEAYEMFKRAWNKATNNIEKFTAAHYLARHQKNVVDKLNWDETALHLALEIDDENIRLSYPSLYLNIAKCYEDLNDLDNARKNYQIAFSYVNLLADDGYGNMIKSGITNGVERVAKSFER